jgi:hypothetical protein
MRRRMSRWRVVPARRSLASVIALPVSSRSPRSGVIVSRRADSAARVSPFDDGGGDPPGLLTRPGAAL